MIGLVTLDEIRPLRYKTNLKKRIFATLIDYGLFYIFLFGFIFFFGTENEEGETSGTGPIGLIIPIVWFLYFVVVEWLFGGTIGHSGFYLKVVTFNRNNIDFTQALRRHLLDPIDIFSFYGIPAIVAIKNSEKHQRIGDMWAKTVVVDTSDPEQFNSEQVSIT